eukprot:CAMPEP_0184527978 /NCGR_PEP_ID=MMETSP0198_2-20121128/11526_1 /TAXON_ID=1112570 /ORGANISM="Thraustochytrium sp., Strain LLF1b" /LENGTH=323 /DNA_ID=CAMNT_0026919753 /DNA_START=370 /DNA_END=1338 /DNA_ORIENTATION=+
MYGQALRHGAKRRHEQVLLPRELERYPLNVAVDFRACETSTLKKYLSKYGIDDGNTSSATAMARKVAKHFDENLEVTEEKVISRFAQYINEYGDDPSSKRSKNKRYGTRSGRSGPGSDDEDDGEPKAPLYCICDQPSFGEMIGCDNDNCKREWFHLECVGIKPAQLKSGQEWYCSDCRVLMEKSSSRADASKDEGGGGKSDSTAKEGVKREGPSSNSNGATTASETDADIDSSTTSGSNKANGGSTDAIKKEKDMDEAMDIGEGVGGDDDAKSMTYSQMITEALRGLPRNEGTFKEICDKMEKVHGTSLNWKPESEIRKSPVW